MKPPDSRTYFDLLQEQAERHPAGLAVICGAREVGYARLADAARHVAGALRASGIRRGDRIGLLINNRLEWLELCFAANALGAVLVPFSTWSTEAELAYLLADSGVALLVALDRFAGHDFAATLASLVPETPGARFPALRRLVMLDDAPGGYAAFKAEAEPVGPLPRDARGDPEGDALILYTSGSSARPKAVRLVNRALVENGFNIGERMGLTPDDRVLVAPPLFWSYGSANALAATLTHGATLVLQGRFDPGEAIQLIERHRCTAIYTLPAMTGAILDHPSFDAARVRSLRTGLTLGGPQDLRVVAERLGAERICNIYGSTEVYGNCCVTPADWPLAERSTCQGPPLPGVTIRIVDPDTRRPVEPGQTGEAEITGHVSPGYAGASAAHNDATFTEDGYFRSGDLGFLDDRGRFHFVGRGSEMIKRAGINVSPAEVEEALQRHDRVAAAAVVGAPDARRGEAIVAFVVPAKGARIGADELRSHCCALLSRYKLPDRIEICDALPVTTTGKLFKRALKDRAAALMAEAAAEDG